jgi:hypothetical protein
MVIVQTCESIEALLTLKGNLDFKSLSVSGQMIEVYWTSYQNSEVF